MSSAMLFMEGMEWASRTTMSEKIVIKKEVFKLK
jgi:hypothetical protein